MTTLISFVVHSSTSAVTIASDKQTITAVGTDSASITATVKDSYGYVVAGTPLVFTADKSVRLTASSRNTDNNGQATVQAYSTQAGKFSVTARASASWSTDTVSLSFTADVSTAVVSEINASPSGNIVADGEAYSTVTATVRDAGKKTGGGG